MKRGLAIFLAVVLTIGAVGFIGLCLESVSYTHLTLPTKA